MWRTTNLVEIKSELVLVSIHVPRVEDDLDDIPASETPAFQSTSPVWRTTCEDEQIPFEGFVSIHVPRVEDDL